MSDAPSLTDRLFLAGIRKGALEPLAVRALNKAVHLLSLALATRLQNLRAFDDPLLNAAGRIEEQAVLLNLHHEIANLLGERWDKVPAKHRPHFTPGQRFRILRIKRLLALSPEDAAHLFRVSPGTISAWLAELSSTTRTGANVGRELRVLACGRFGPNRADQYLRRHVVRPCLRAKRANGSLQPLHPLALRFQLVHFDPPSRKGRVWQNRLVAFKDVIRRTLT
jgi:hypothetical protein